MPRLYACIAVIPGDLEEEQTADQNHPAVGVESGRAGNTAPINSIEEVKAEPVLKKTTLQKFDNGLNICR